MGMIRVAIRNIFRNKRRSFLTALSLLVAGFVIVALHGYLRGALGASREMIIKLDTGHVLITKKDYFERRIFLPQEDYIDDTQDLEILLNNSKYVDFYTMRLKAGAMLFTNDGASKHAVIFALDPEKEKKAFNLEPKVIEGTYDLSIGCLVAADFARSLKIKLGDSLIILTKSVRGGLSAIKLPVTGIAEVEYATLDRSLVILSIKNARKLLKIENGVHEILVFLKKETYIQKFINSLDLPQELGAYSYTFALGSFAFFYRFADIFYMGIYILITILAAFAIVNTMTVAVFERMREIGTLKAIGMADREIFKLFGLEGTIIGATGGLVGSLLGLFINLILHIKGINFENMIKGIEFPFPYVIRPAVNLWIVVMAFVIVIVISFLAATLPALQARRLTPQEALKEV